MAVQYGSGTMRYGSTLRTERYGSMAVQYGSGTMRYGSTVRTCTGGMPDVSLYLSLSLCLSACVRISVMVGARVFNPSVIGRCIVMTLHRSIRPCLLWALPVVVCFSHGAAAAGANKDALIH